MTYFPQRILQFRMSLFNHAVALLREAGRGALPAKSDIGSVFYLLLVHLAVIILLGTNLIEILILKHAFLLDHSIPLYQDV